MKRTIEILENMQRAIRRTFSAENPIELGFPIPVNGTGGSKERAFALYRSAFSESAAFAVVEAEASSNADAVVTFCTDENPFNQPLDAVVDRTLPEKMSYDEYIAARDVVIRCYDSIRTFLWQSPDQAQQEQMRQYREAFQKVVPKGLYPYYFMLNPQFFIWMGLNIDRA